MSQTNTVVTIDSLSFVNPLTGEKETHPIKNTEYGVVEKGSAGLCPALPNEETTKKFLRQDGTWVDPHADIPVISTQEINEICV